MWNEDPDDELGVPRGFVNAFIIMILFLVLVGTIWEAITR